MNDDPMMIAAPEVTPIRVERADLSTQGTPERPGSCSAVAVGGQSSSSILHAELEAEAKADLAKMQEARGDASSSGAASKWVKKEYRYEAMAEEMKKWSLEELQREVGKTMNKYVTQRSGALKPHTDLRDTREGRYESTIYNNAAAGELNDLLVASAGSHGSTALLDGKDRQRILHNCTMAELLGLQNPTYRARGWPIIRCNICQDPLKDATPIHSCILDIRPEVVDALKDDDQLVRDENDIPVESCGVSTTSDEQLMTLQPTTALPVSALLAVNQGPTSPMSAGSFCSVASQSGGAATSSVAIVMGGEEASSLRRSISADPAFDLLRGSHNGSIVSGGTTPNPPTGIRHVASSRGGSITSTLGFDHTALSPLAVEANGNVVIIKQLGRSGVSRRHHFCQPCYLLAIDSVQSSVGCPMCGRPVPQERDLVTEMVVRDQWKPNV